MHLRSTFIAHSTDGLLLKRGCQRKPPPASSLSGPWRHNSLMASCFSEALRSYAKLMNWETNRYRQKSEGRRPLLKVKLPQQGLSRSPSTALHTVYFAQMEMEGCLGCDVSLHLRLMHVHKLSVMQQANQLRTVLKSGDKILDHFQQWCTLSDLEELRPMTFQLWIEYFSFRIDTR